MGFTNKGCHECEHITAIFDSFKAYTTYINAPCLRVEGDFVEKQKMKTFNLLKNISKFTGGTAFSSLLLGLIS